MIRIDLTTDSTSDLKILCDENPCLDALATSKRTSGYDELVRLKQCGYDEIWFDETVGKIYAVRIRPRKHLELTGYGQSVLKNMKTLTRQSEFVSETPKTGLTNGKPKIKETVEQKLDRLYSKVKELGSDALTDKEKEFLTNNS